MTDMSTETRHQRLRRFMRDLPGVYRIDIDRRQAEVITVAANLLESEHYHVAAAELRTALAELEGQR